MEILRSIVESRTREKISNRSRKREVVDARKVFCLILNQEGNSFKDIGRKMGYDHSSVMNNVNTAIGLIESNSHFKYLYFSIKEEYNNKKLDIPLHLYIGKLPDRVKTYVDSVSFDNAELKKELDFYRSLFDQRLFEIFEIIKQNTPIYTEEAVKRKIKKALNA